MQSLWLVGMYNLLLEIAQDRQEIVGVYNFLVTSITTPTSLIGGALLRYFSYPVLFIVTAFLIATGLVIAFSLAKSRVAKSGGKK